MILAFIALYVVAQLVIGGLVARRVASEEDYLVAGRSLGPALATASMFATWFGAETCVGAAGEVYARGFTGVAADPFGYGLCLILFGLLIARPLWRAKVTTIADIYRDRYSKGVERMVALLLIPGSILWAAAQIRAFGTVVASTTDLIGVEEGLLVAALVTVIYTSLGGLLADAYTDLVQGGVLVLTLVVLAVAAGMGPNTLADLSAGASAAPEALSWLDRAEGWSVPILGSLFAQELAARAAAARSGELARRASLSAGGIYILVGLLPVGLGLLARVRLPDLEHPEAALPEMARLHLGTIGQGVLAGALVSAILSTIDSALLAASGLLTHNLTAGLGKGSGKAKLRWARAGVILLGALAWWLATRAESVHGLVEEASGLGSAGFLWVGLAGMFTRWGGNLSAYLTLAAGAVGYLAADHAFGSDHPFLTSLLFAGGAWAVGLVLERALGHTNEAPSAG